MLVAQAVAAVELLFYHKVVNPTAAAGSEDAVGVPYACLWLAQV